MNTKTHTIDAKGKKLGRVASEAAHVLMGKNLVTFVKNARPDVHVTITNASKLAITEKKRSGKLYTHFTGHVGGLRFESLDALVARRGYREALMHAIRGMMPNNKLRPDTLKRVTIQE